MAQWWVKNFNLLKGGSGLVRGGRKGVIEKAQILSLGQVLKDK